MLRILSRQSSIFGGNAPPIHPLLQIYLHPFRAHLYVDSHPSTKNHQGQVFLKMDQLSGTDIINRAMKEVNPQTESVATILNSTRTQFYGPRSWKLETLPIIHSIRTCSYVPVYVQRSAPKSPAHAKERSDNVSLESLLGH